MATLKKTPATKTAAAKKAPAAKPTKASTTSAKPVTPKPVAAKPAAKKAAVKTVKAAPKAPAKPKADKTPKEKKPKLVRDSFTIPKAEYGVLEELKARAGKLGRPVKKSELLRAGIKALAALTDADYVKAIGGRAGHQDGPADNRRLRLLIRNSRTATKC